MGSYMFELSKTTKINFLKNAPTRKLLNYVYLLGMILIY